MTQYALTALLAIPGMLLWAGYYHPQRYHIFIFLPLTVISLLSSIWIIASAYGFTQAAIEVLPYVDPEKIAEVRQIVESSRSFLNWAAAITAIINISALLASLLQAAGIVWTNRGR